MPKVSVIIPVYNNETYLKQCIDSIVKQTMEDIEIICINDGSTDGSLEILKEYDNTDGRLFLIDKPNSGYGDSLNKGLDIARGEYVAVVESDDFIENDMFLELYNAACKYDLDIVKSNYYEFSADKETKYKELNNKISYNTVYEPYRCVELFTGEIYLWTSIYKKAFLDANNIRFNPSPGASYQDVGFTFKALACAERVMSIEKAFYHYRQDNPNSSIHSKEKVYCICDEFDEIKRFCDVRPDVLERMRNIIPYMMFKRYMGTYGRIEKKYKAQFLIRMKRDLGKYSEEELNPNIWSPEDWSFYQQIESKCVSSCLHKKLNDFVIPAIVSYLKNRNVYIYGAGQVGHKVYEWLELCGIHAKCFLVTSLSGEGAIDLPVEKFADVKNMLSDDDCILVAVGEKLQSEIVVSLLEEGIENIIPMNIEMRNIIGI